MIMFAFPYAFGNKNIFKIIEQKIDNITVSPIEYSGHGSRYMRPFCKSVSEMAYDAYEQIKGNIYLPYSLLGYSMGALVAFELCRIIEKMGDIPPARLFLFAADAPDYKRGGYKWSGNDLEDIRTILNFHGNTPNVVLDDIKMLEILLPVVKNDTKVLDSYSAEEHSNKRLLSCPVTLVRGKREEDAERSIVRWKKYIQNEIELILVDGDHFFLFDNSIGTKESIDIIKNKLNT